MKWRRISICLHFHVKLRHGGCPLEHYPLIVFSDFDGTITEKESLEEFIQLFINEDIQDAAARMLQEGYSVKGGIREMMSRIPVEEYLQNTWFFDTLTIRRGFPEFVKVLQQNQIPLVVISGGIREMVVRNLEPFMDGIQQLYTAEVDLNEKYVRYWSDYETDLEIVGKREVMSRYSYDTSICIGDSYTDFIMAQAADIIFARDRLAENLNKHEIPYFPYDTFHDIIQQLNCMLPTQKN